VSWERFANASSIGKTLNSLRCNGVNPANAFSGSFSAHSSSSEGNRVTGGETTLSTALCKGLMTSSGLSSNIVGLKRAGNPVISLMGGQSCPPWKGEGIILESLGIKDGVVTSPRAWRRPENSCLKTGLVSETHGGNHAPWRITGAA